MISLHDGLYRVYNSIFYYLRAVANKLYNSIVCTRRCVPGTQYTVYNSIFDYLLAVAYKLYKTIVRPRWRVHSIQCITRSTFVYTNGCNSMFARLGTDYEIMSQWFFVILEAMTID